MNNATVGNQIDPNTQPDNLEDSTNTEIQSLPPKLYMWKLSETLGKPYHHTCRHSQPQLPEHQSGGRNVRPLQLLGKFRFSTSLTSVLRTGGKRTYHLHGSLLQFFTRPDQVLFTNSNVPYTNLTYYKAGNKVNGEERFKSYFSVNVNKQLAFGFNIDYLYGRGYYQNQSTSHFNAGLLVAIYGEKYQVQARSTTNFFLKMNENGGIADDQYITRPETCLEERKSMNPPLYRSNWNGVPTATRIFISI